MSTIGTQILEQIARIKNARNKVRAQAVALGLKRWYPDNSENIISCNASMSDIWETSAGGNIGDKFKLTLKFSDVETRNKIKNDSFTLINIYDYTNFDDAVIYYAPYDPNSKIVSADSNSLETDTLTYFFELPCMINEICLGVYQEQVDDMPITATLYVQQGLVDDDKLDAVADAFASMTVKKAETITANALLTDGFYKGCTVNVPTGDGACEHVQTNATVDFGTGTVIFTDMAGKVLETSVYDANDIEKDKYVVNEVYVTNVPDTTALEQQVETLENELENINTELEGM